MPEMPDLNDLLRVYLGAGEDGGYQPIGSGEDRLAEAYPDKDISAMLAVISQYLDYWIDDLPSSDLAEAGAHFEAKIASKYPELNDISKRALSNRYTWDWR